MLTHNLTPVEQIIDALGVETQQRMAMLVLDGWKFTHSSDQAIANGVSNWVAFKGAWVDRSADDPAAQWNARAGTLRVLLDRVWFDYGYHRDTAGTFEPCE